LKITEWNDECVPQDDLKIREWNDWFGNNRLTEWWFDNHRMKWCTEWNDGNAMMKITEWNDSYKSFPIQWIVGAESINLQICPLKNLRFLVDSICIIRYLYRADLREFILRENPFYERIHSTRESILQKWSRTVWQVERFQKSTHLEKFCQRFRAPNDWAAVTNSQQSAL